MITLFMVFVGLAIANGMYYRRDYVYYKEFDAFYKIHWDLNLRSWINAFEVCESEGAQLFSPREDLEWAVVKNLTHTLSPQLNTSEALVGIRDHGGLGDFVHVNGQRASIEIQKSGQCDSGPCCVHMRIDTGSFKTYSCDLAESIPFVCKRVNFRICPTTDPEYIHNKDLRKCYKVHSTRKTWQEAYHTCYQEGAMLVVVDDEREAEHIYEIIGSTWYYNAGFYKNGDNYYTITGKKLEDVYKMWYIEPTYACGAIDIVSNVGNTTKLYTNTINCSYKRPFVCEMNETIKM